jgi:formate dehydrogenase maturation protein FdhE
MLTQPTTTQDPVVQRLNALAQATPELRDAAEIYAAILPLLRDRPALAMPVAMTPAEARLKMQRGSFLLEAEELAFDEWNARELLIQLARGLEAVPELDENEDHWLWVRVDRRKKPRSQGPLAGNDGEMMRATSARQIRLLLERGELEAGVLLARVAAGDRAFIIALAEDMDLDAGILWALSRYALLPALHAWRSQLAPLVEGAEWEKEFCFVCGADASFGELRGDEQAKHLRCCRCGADWSMRRSVCVHCGNKDPRTLSELYPDGKGEQYRVEVCDNCKGHLKVITSSDPTPPEQLIYQDWSTLHLDMIAQQHGYH